MTDERLIIAIGRLERALTRVEAAAMRAPRQDPETAMLARRHERLRARTQDAIEALDRLIAG